MHKIKTLFSVFKNFVSDLFSIFKDEFSDFNLHLRNDEDYSDVFSFLGYIVLVGFILLLLFCSVSAVSAETRDFELTQDMNGNYVYNDTSISFYPKRDDYSTYADSARARVIAQTDAVRTAKNAMLYGYSTITCSVWANSLNECESRGGSLVYNYSFYAMTNLLNDDTRGLSKMEMDSTKNLFFTNNYSGTTLKSVVSYYPYRDNYINSYTSSGNNIIPTVPAGYEEYAGAEGYNGGFIFDPFANLYVNVAGSFDERSISTFILYYAKFEYEVLYNITSPFATPYFDFYDLFDLGPAVFPESDYNPDTFYPQNGCSVSSVEKRIEPSLITDPAVNSAFANFETAMEDGVDYLNLYRSFSDTEFLYHDFIFINLATNDDYTYQFTYDENDNTRIKKLSIDFDSSLNDVVLIRYRSDNLITPFEITSDLDNAYLSNISKNSNHFEFDLTRNYDKMTEFAYSAFLADKTACDNGTGSYSVLLSFCANTTVDNNPDSFFNKIDVFQKQYYDVLRELKLLSAGSESVIPPSRLPEIEDGVYDSIDFSDSNALLAYLVDLNASITRMSGNIRHYFKDLYFIVNGLPGHVSDFISNNDYNAFASLINNFYDRFPSIAYFTHAVLSIKVLSALFI